MFPALCGVVKEEGMICSDCPFLKDLDYSAHHYCDHPAIRDTVFKLLLASGVAKIRTKGGEPIVKLNEHGVRNGWAFWPMNFDPVWVESCSLKVNNSSVSDSVSGAVSDM